MRTTKRVMGHGMGPNGPHLDFKDAQQQPHVVFAAQAMEAGALIWTPQAAPVGARSTG